MRSDPVPFLTNFYLYFIENKWMSETKRIEVINSRKFGTCLRNLLMILQS